MEHLGQFILNHWYLWLALLIILLLILINEALEQKKKAKELSPHAAVDLINHENAVVIDIRDKETYKQGHIINSINASAEDLSSQQMKKYKDKPIILVCARGLQSAALAAKLHGQGFDKVIVLGGGMTAWQAAELPVIKAKG